MRGVRPLRLVRLRDAGSPAGDGVPEDLRWAIRGEGDAPCRVCGFREADEGTARLSTRGLTFLGLEWLN